jgi:AhpD family alkylhydroperoxidase
MKAVIALEDGVQKSGLDPRLMELVKLHASQVNGCVYCLDMHGRDARAKGETLSATTIVRSRRSATKRGVM